MCTASWSGVEVRWLTAVQVIDVPQRLVTGTAEQTLYLLVSGTEQPSVHLLPDTPESRGFVKALPQDLFFWQADKASGERCWMKHCSGLCRGYG